MVNSVFALPSVAMAVDDNISAHQRSVIQEFRLQTNDANASDFAGSAISVWGNRLLLGVPDDDDGGSSSGSAYVFEFNGTDWVQMQKLTAPDALAGDRFGDAVDLRGDRAVIGAPVGDGLVGDSGAAYVFEFDGANWQFDTKLTADDGQLSDRFGVAVSQSNDRILVGASGDDDLGNQSGSAYLFELQGGSWTQLPKLNASDGDAIAEFGLSVSLSGDRALIGAPGDDEIAIVAGAGYLFEPVGGVWQETAKLVVDTAALGDALGVSGALDGDRAVLGASGDGGTGAVYVFDFDGVNWVQSVRLVGDDLSGGELFGEVLAHRDNQILVGAPQGSSAAGQTGAAYRFEFAADGWQQMDKFVASDGAAQDRLGASVSLFGSRYVAGADEDDNAGSNSGAGYVFQDSTDLVLSNNVAAAVVAGTDLDFSLQVTNNGTALARNVVLDHTLTPALTANSISAPCAGGFPCALGDIAAGTSVTVDFSYAVPSDLVGAVNIQSGVSSDTVEAASGDESVDTLVVINAEADLSVTKSGPINATAGEMVTYQIQINQAGPSQAQRLVLDDTPLNGLTFVSASAPCDGGFPCDLGDLDAGGTLMVDATFQAMPGFSGVATNSATISSSTTDPDSSNDTDTADTFVDVVVDLAMGKQGPAEITAGSTVQYQLTVTNLSTSDAPEVTIADPTPAGLTLQSASAPCGSGFPCNLGTVNASAMVSVDVVYALDSDLTGSVTNSATVSTPVTDSDDTNDSASVQSQVVTAADLALTVSTTGSAAAGDTFTLDFVLTNNGPSDALNTRILNPAPVPASFLMGTTPCEAGFPCALNTLTAGASVMFSATFITDSAQTGDIQLTFDATSNTDDPELADNTEAVMLTLAIVHDAILVSKVSGTAHVEAGEPTVYFISVDNQGPSDAVNLNVTDVLPAELENPVWTCNSTGGQCQTGNGNGDVDVLIDLPLGATALIEVNADVSAAVQEGEVIINRATVTVPAGSSDPVPQNNSAEDRDIVGLFADSFEADF